MVSKFKYIIAFSVSFATLTFGSTEDFVSRVSALLLIDNKELAMKECENALMANSKSVEQFLFIIKTCAEASNYDLWHKAIEQAEEEYPSYNFKNRDVIENFCWSILRLGRANDSKFVRFMSNFVAGISSDVRSTDIIKKGMIDDNTDIRKISFRLSALNRQQVVRDEAVKLLVREPMVEVREEIYKAIAALKIREAEPKLQEILKYSYIGMHEKLSIISCLAELRGRPSEEEVLSLVRSNNEEFRCLGCELINRYNLKEYVNELVLLSEDNTSSVRERALYILSCFDKAFLLNNEQIQEQVINISKEAMSIDETLYIAKLLLIYDNEDGIKLIKSVLFSNDALSRSKASNVLMTAGSSSYGLAKQIISSGADWAVKIKAALYLLQSRECIEEAGALIDKEIRNDFAGKSLDEFSNVMEEEISTVMYNDRRDSIKLSMLRLLLVSSYSNGLDLLKLFVDKSLYGKDICGFAKILMEEGQDSLIKFIEKYMSSNDPLEKVQAGIIMAFILGSEDSMQNLQNMYVGQPWRIKIMILDSMMAMANVYNANFLLECCKEQMFSLKVISAGALLVSMMR